MNAHTPIRPSNIEAEQGVLGALLLNNGLVAALGFLKAEHFDEEIHRAIFEAIVARTMDGRPANAVTLAGDIPATPDFSVPSYLARLSASAWTASEQIAGTARELVLLAAKRSLGRVGEEVVASVAMPGIRVPDLLASVEMSLIQLSDEVGQLNAKTQTTPVDALNEVRQRMDTGRYIVGAECGLVAIDQRLGGFSPGQLIIVAGRPGMGKTMFGLSMARRAAHVGTGIAFDSIEMSADEVWHRLLSDEALSTEAIPYKAIRRGRISEQQYATLERARDRIRDMPLRVIDRGNRLSDLPGHIRSARRWLAKRGKDLQVLVVDYLGLLQPGDRYAGQKVNEVGEISATLKALAKREGIAVIALHQLNRQNEARGEDRRPRLSDLRDSGNLEQDADVVMFVYRDAYYVERPGYRTFAGDAERLDALAECQHQLEVIIAKQRQGEIATCRLWCDPATNSVRDEAR